MSHAFGARLHDHSDDAGFATEGGGGGGGGGGRPVGNLRPVGKLSIESLSKTTKYEDEGVLANFCRLHIILRILSWTSLAVAQRVFPCVAVYAY
jgi:hypothetical protein